MMINAGCTNTPHTRTGYNRFNSSSISPEADSNGHAFQAD